MITIKITDHSICMNGHAGRKSPDGIDRVCDQFPERSDR